MSIKIETYHIDTCMGKLHRYGNSNPLPFLDEKQQEDFDEVGYTGKLNGTPESYEGYLNGLELGTFQVSQTKQDTGDFCEKFTVVRAINE